MFLIQMAGFPGAGKSTLAKEISNIIDAIIIDVDVIKTSLIESGIDSKLIANAAYHTLFSLGEYYLSLNKSIIIDTPCYYEETLDNGISLAMKFKAEYKYIECRTDNYEEIDRRLKTREKRLSQYDTVEKEVFFSSYDKSIYPKNKEIIIVDSSLPVSSYIQKVIDYIEDKDNNI